MSSNIININDNSTKKYTFVEGIEDHICDDGLMTAGVRNDLLLLANKPISSFISDDLLVFPRDIEKTEDGIEKQKICELCNDKSTVDLQTGNVMGVVGINDIQLRIKSRFDTDCADYFLHYMLQKVFHFNLFELEADAGSEQVFDFRWYLFPYLLKRAIRQGIFKTYRTYKRNNSHVKGRIDVSRHLATNVPFQGKVAYTMRESSIDNALMQLIRHTIELAKKHSLGKLALGADSEMIDAVRQVQLATPSYNLQDRRRVIADNNRSFAHPYFTDYMPLRKLCLQLLRNETISYTSDTDKVYGVLFDGAWLWEEYLYTVLRTKGFTHPENKKGVGACYLFKESKDHRRFPDYYNDKMVIDAKYKRLEKGIDRDDMHQLVTYMHILNHEAGEFIYPIEFDLQQKENILNKYEREEVGELQGFGGKVSTIGVPIPKGVNSFSDYKKLMQKIEEKLGSLYT